MQAGTGKTAVMKQAAKKISLVTAINTHSFKVILNAIDVVGYIMHYTLSQASNHAQLSLSKQSLVILPAPTPPISFPTPVIAPLY